jgi:predicted enzyme related to lactoylglutathione lyase
MKRVSGIGGIFFKCEDPEATRAWYERHLGFQTDQYGTSFEWRRADDPNQKGFTVWSPMKATTAYLDPSSKGFMINYRVENLAELVEILKSEGVTILDEIEQFEYGKFVHILDPDGQKVELWEPVDAEFDRMLNVRMG